MSFSDGESKREYTQLDKSSTDSVSPEKKKAKIESQLDNKEIIKRGRFIPLCKTQEDVENMYSAPDWVEHFKQMNESEGYEIDVFPEFANCQPVKDLELYVDNCKESIHNYNTTNNTDYEFVQMLRAIYYGPVCLISFRVKSKGVEKDFQTKWVFKYGGIEEFIYVRPKPEKKE